MGKVLQDTETQRLPLIQKFVGHPQAHSHFQSWSAEHLQVSGSKVSMMWGSLDRTATASGNLPQGSDRCDPATLGLWPPPLVSWCPRSPQPSSGANGLAEPVTAAARWLTQSACWAPGLKTGWRGEGNKREDSEIRRGRGHWRSSGRGRGSRRRGGGKKSSKRERLTNPGTWEARSKDGEGTKDPMPFLTSSGVHSHLFIPM